MSLRKKANRLILNRTFIVVLFVLFSVGASFQSLTGAKTYEDGGVEYNKYNNYTIFERSFEHLKNEQDLYQLYPEEQWDLYKYSPSFALLP